MPARHGGLCDGVARNMTYAMFLSTHRLIKVLDIMVILAVAWALLKPSAGSRFFPAIERRFRMIARQRWKAVGAAALFPLVLRALMLPWYPPPNPIVHDEFSYLLQADTFAHGRLANPTPPQWKHFETEYTLLQPTYASQYEPAQGLALAAGQVLFGHPWWGVWVSVGIMCAALCWALGFVFPPSWALFGALIAALQFGIFGIWMNSYFGGAVSATAGALVFAALARLHDAVRWRGIGMLCAFAIILLFATRPFEAILWSGVALGYAGWFLRKRKCPIDTAAAKLLPSFALVFLAGAGALAYYNWRITGSALTPPYLAYQRIYGTPQPYWWQPPFVVTHFNYPELRDNYLNQFHLYEARYSAAALFRAEGERLWDFWRFFIGPFLTVPLLFAGSLLRDRKVWPWLLASVPFIADKATYHAWFPAQNGPATVLIVLLLVQCWRHLRAWKRTRRLGMAVSRMLIAAFCLAVMLGGLGRALEPILPNALRHLPPIWESLYPPRRLRDDVTARLEQIPGKHLLFVRYSYGHCFCEEWVFNRADLKNQRIVYARPYSPQSDEALIQTFKHFHFDAWVIEPDLHPYRLAHVRPGEVASLSLPLSEE